MNDDHDGLREQFRESINRLAVVQQGAAGSVAMEAMAIGTMAMLRDIPQQLRYGAILAARRWIQHDLTAKPLEPARVASWSHLDVKHGNSTTVADRSDLAVRCLICVLWDDEPMGDDLEDTVDFFLGLAVRYGGLEHALDIDGAGFT